MSKRLKDKVAIITGAADGIGKASAIKFASEGARVIVSDINEDHANAVTHFIEQQGGNATTLICDVTDRQQVQMLIDETVGLYGQLDVLYNNAGGSTPSAYIDLSEEQFQQIMKLNFDSTHYATKAALAVMVKQQSGCIITTSSGAGINYSPGLVAYGAAKAALTSLTRSIAVEYGPMGIRANIIAPGPIETVALRGWLDSLDQDKTDDSPGTYQRWSKHVPVGRLGKPEDIANAALFLASDEAAFINGVLLPVDGAVHAMLSSAE